MVSEWFKHIAFIVHFISNLMLPLIWQEVPIWAWRLETPVLRMNKITWPVEWENEKEAEGKPLGADHSAWH